MIDNNFKVKRYIAEFCEKTEMHITNYDLASFNLDKFQIEFNEPDPKNPMFDCYQIKEQNVEFIERYIDNKISWDFTQKVYFVEAHAI